MRIAILGWGSLIWDNDPKFADFNKQFEKLSDRVWQPDGPQLNLEFSRISQTRGQALTLVIDKDNGEECKVQYAKSRRRNPDDAICDLRCREGTILKRIGFYFADGSRTGQPDVPENIKKWGADKEFDVVIWTELPSNFSQKKGETFSIDLAIGHLQNLEPEDKVKAAEYIKRAPDNIDTPLRRALQNKL